jgi:hypothetical protein
MRLLELFNLSEDGLVVPGVNTTADVKPGEIARQAAKMGFSVSPDGIPPEVSKDSVIKSLPSTPAQKAAQKPVLKPFEKKAKVGTEETTETVDPEQEAKTKAETKPEFPPKKAAPERGTPKKAPAFAAERDEKDYSAFHKKKTEPVKESDETLEEDDPCWKNYEMVGMKKKGKKTVPNCVPKKKS